MANLEGVRPRGAKSDHIVWITLHSDTARLSEIYRSILAAARDVGLGPDVLPDFLGIEESGNVATLGQDEMNGSLLEQLLREALSTKTDHPST